MGQQWFPQHGPQLAAIEADWVSELFYGGERGGGKSDFQLGYQEDGALRYAEGWRGIMFRKTYPELEELQSRAMEIFPASGATFKSQQSAGHAFSNSWYWPNGASVKMRYIENERDYGRYHGHQYCVGVNTRIWMADGSLKAIWQISIGDMVATLEGPRRVLATVRPYYAPCVKLTLPHGHQIQPVWHPVLANVLERDESSGGLSQKPVPPQLVTNPWLSSQLHPGQHPENPPTFFYSTNGQSGSLTSEGELRVEKQPLRSNVRVVLSSQLVRLAVYPSSIRRLVRDRLRERFWGKCQEGFSLWLKDHLRPGEPWRLGWGRAERVFAYAHASYAQPEKPSILGWLRRCVSDFRPGGARSHRETTGAQSFAQQQVDVAEQGRDGFQKDETDYIPEYSHRALYTYIHPYTKERRHGALPLELGNAQIEFYGNALVCDLTIEGVNHYVSEVGLVNKNTGISFDEVTEYATPSGLLRMLSTLRSAAGVPCTVRLTGNPGGVGHSWVKTRYIDIGPARSPYKDPETGFTRMFIPSKLSDNSILLRADPEYRSRILAATYGNDALRKAWLEGDWNIVAGAFFNCWSQKMIVQPFAIPDHWLRFRSGDWGSARPFSIGWWAVASEDIQLPSNQIIPKGALVKYREWYGCEDPARQPNTGIKMPAEEVGAGILHLEHGEKITYGVLDPSAFASDGGPSIAERIYRGSGNRVQFRRADNSRVGTKGALGGWDQMRARMIGEDARPMLYFFSTCRDSIRTIPLLQHDEARVEDIDTDMEDHAGDETRYACMSRPYIKPSPQLAPKPRYLGDLTADELFFPAKTKKRIERI